MVLWILSKQLLNIFYICPKFTFIFRYSIKSSATFVYIQDQTSKVCSLEALSCGIWREQPTCVGWGLCRKSIASESESVRGLDHLLTLNDGGFVVPSQGTIQAEKALWSSVNIMSATMITTLTTNSVCKPKCNNHDMFNLGQHINLTVWSWQPLFWFDIMLNQTKTCCQFTHICNEACSWRQKLRKLVLFWWSITMLSFNLKLFALINQFLSLQLVWRFIHRNMKSHWHYWVQLY